MDEIQKVRDRIDWLDSQIAVMLNERMRAVDQIGKLKKDSGQPVLDDSRERNVLDSALSSTYHPILKDCIEDIYQEITKAARKSQQFYRHTSQPFRCIGFIGLGLIGGSICKALKTKDPSLKISAMTTSENDLAIAIEGRWIDSAAASVAELISQCELVIIATPLSFVIPIAEEIKKCGKNILVMDVASVKEPIVDVFECLSGNGIEFIGTHPMAGKESQGFINSEATLFTRKPWIVCPHQLHTDHALQAITDLIHYLGGMPLSLESSVHDHWAALVSHLPMNMAKQYSEFVKSMDPECLSIAGPGFHSFTRLAQDNPIMRKEIASMNKAAIQSYRNQWLMHMLKEDIK